MNGHLSETDLAAYLDDRLSRRRRQEVEAHLAGCDECLGQVADAAEALANPEPLPLNMGQLPAVAAGPRQRPTRWRPVFGVAAALLVVLSVALVLRVEHRLPLASEAEKIVSDHLTDGPAAMAPSPGAEPQPTAVDTVPAPVDARVTGKRKAVGEVEERKLAAGESVSPGVVASPVKDEAFAVESPKGNLADRPVTAAAPPSEKKASALARDSARADARDEASAVGGEGMQQRQEIARQRAVLGGVAPPAPAAERGRREKELRQQNQAGAVGGLGVVPLDPRIRVGGAIAESDLLDGAALNELATWGMELRITLVIDADGRQRGEAGCDPELSAARMARLRSVLARVRFAANGALSRRVVLRVVRSGEPPPGDAR
jgi:hypothetical protein